MDREVGIQVKHFACPSSSIQIPVSYDWSTTNVHFPIRFSVQPAWMGCWALGSGLIGSIISEISISYASLQSLDGVQNSREQKCDKQQNEQPKSYEENPYLKPEWRREALVEKYATESKL